MEEGKLRMVIAIRERWEAMGLDCHVGRRAATKYREPQATGRRSDCTSHSRFSLRSLDPSSMPGTS